jgi:hypothetical protein
MEENDNGTPISPKKLEANRRNAQLSTGPNTEQGKAHSRRNALKHGVLAATLLVSKGLGAEDSSEFDELLKGLHEDIMPVGVLEEMLVEKIAVCWWRQRRALQSEAGLIERAFVAEESNKVSEGLVRFFGGSDKSERGTIKDHLRLPLGNDLDRILRYETTIQRQLIQAINQLERLQRMRRGENIPAPISVQLSNDH